MSVFMSEHGISEAANAPGAQCCSPLEITQPLISSIKKGGGKKATQHLQNKTSQNEPFRTGTVAGLLSNLHHINSLTVPHGLYYFGSHRQQTSAWFPTEEPRYTSTVPASMSAPSPPLLINWFLMALSTR